jgi:hypothetical protein
VNVFVSETCYRQVYGSAKGSSARRVDDFNRLVARLQAARTRDDLQVKGLGTKKYRSLNHDVYGVDLNNGLTAERVIFLFVEPDDLAVEGQIGRYRLPGEDESVLLCYCSEHDSQHRHAQLVGQAAGRGAAPDVAQVLPSTAVAELERVERLEVPWRTFGPGDLEHYGSPRTPVLTEDKFRIVADVLSRPGPVLVTGAAGSGKTELGLRLMAEVADLLPNEPRLLYLTFSPALVAEVQTRCPALLRPRATFLTFDALLRSLASDGAARFAGPAAFERFAAALRERPAMGGRERGRMLRLLDERGVGCAYAEVYGVVGGSMGPAWDRPVVPGDASAEGPDPLMPLDLYLGLPAERSNLADEGERRAAWWLADAFARWCAAAGLCDRNAAALAAAGRAGSAARFDLVVADEVQDLTEVQLELLFRLAGGRADTGRDALLFMTGDANQVLSPTGFDARRTLRLDPSVRLARLQGNFRNSAVVCELANAVGELRAASPRLVARRAVVDAPEQSFNRSTGRTLWWVGDDEERLLAMADEAANVALVCDGPTWRRLHAKSASVFTVEQVKGMEFENVILYGTLAGSERRFDALFEEGPKDPSLHRVLNKLYVGLTRSCGSLLMAEPRETGALLRLAAADAHFERVQSLSDVDFELDASARGYLRVGRALKGQGAWTAARANLERACALAAGDPCALDAAEREDAERLARACRVYAAHDPETTPPARLAALLDGEGLPEEALPHARAALDGRLVAALTLAADRGLDGARFGWEERMTAFERACEVEGVDVFDLYGLGHDNLLDRYVRDRTDELELYALEVGERVGRVVGALREFA